jgi:hypothetical protein
MTTRLPNNYINAYSIVDNEKSKTFILHMVNRFESLINIRFSEWNFTTFLDIDKIQDKIKDEVLSAQIHLLGTIKRFLMYKNKNNTLIYKKYSQKINSLYKVLNSNRENKIIQKNKSSETLDYNNLKNIFISKIEDIKKCRYIQYRNYLFLGFQLLEIPTNLCNLEHLQYIKEPTTLLKNIENKDFNYISKIDNVYHITYNNYKNKKHIGQINTTITNLHLIDLLDFYFNNFVLESGYMFFNGLEHNSNSNNTTIGEAIRKTSNVLFNKRYSINDYRQGYLKQFYQTERSYEDKVLNCKNMNIIYNPRNDLLFI